METPERPFVAETSVAQMHDSAVKMLIGIIGERQTPYEARVAAATELRAWAELQTRHLGGPLPAPRLLNRSWPGREAQEAIDSVVESPL